MRYTITMRPLWGVWEGKHRIMRSRVRRRILAWAMAEIYGHSLYTEDDSP